MMYRGLLLLCLVIVSMATLANDVRSMPGRLYDIGNIRLHMNCKGTGSPTVMFDSGLGGFSLEWLRIQRLLSDTVRTCAYDRAGYGWSEIGPSPRSTSQIIDEFERLLDAAHLQPPYILVGHSFGGYNVQYYAKANPDKVAGVVLIDSSHPQQAERISDVAVKKTQTSRPRMVSYLADTEMFEKYPEDVREMALQIAGSRKSLITQRRELATFTYSATEVEFLGDTFPDVPLAVISRGQQEWSNHPLGNAREAQWRQMQRELTNLNSQGWQVQAEKSGHLVHLEQPELVADVIRQMVKNCNQNDKLSSC